MPQSSKRSTQIFLGLFILVGVVAIGFGARNLFQSVRCTGWPVTEGVITICLVWGPSLSSPGRCSWGCSLALLQRLVIARLERSKELVLVEGKVLVEGDRHNSFLRINLAVGRRCPVPAELADR
jgi:hypothetical protein